MKNSVQKNGWRSNGLLAKKAHTNLNQVISYTVQPYISYTAKPNISTCLSVYALPARPQELFLLKAAKQNQGFFVSTYGANKKQKSYLTGYPSYFQNHKAVVFLPKAVKDQADARSAEDNNKIHLDKKKILSREANQQNPIAATFTKKSMAYARSAISREFLKAYKPTQKAPNAITKAYQSLTKKPVYTAYSKNDEVRLVTIGLASANRIRQWAEKTLPTGKVVGEVTNANTLHHKTFKPQKGGLFCERIFGPLKDFQCACSNSKRIIIPQTMLLQKVSTNITENGNLDGFSNETALNQERVAAELKLQSPQQSNILVSNNTSLGLLNNYKRFFCAKCDVEYTWSVIRRYQLGYIKLNAPVTHVWYVKGNPSYISLLLDMKKKHVEYVTYCTETLTLENSLKGDQFYTVSDSPSDIFAAWQKVQNATGGMVQNILQPLEQKPLTNSSQRSLKAQNQRSLENMLSAESSVATTKTNLISGTFLAPAVLKTHGAERIKYNSLQKNSLGRSAGYYFRGLLKNKDVNKGVGPIFSAKKSQIKTYSTWDGAKNLSSTSTLTDVSSNLIAKYKNFFKRVATNRTAVSTAVSSLGNQLQRSAKLDGVAQLFPKTVVYNTSGRSQYNIDNIDGFAQKATITSLSNFALNNTLPLAFKEAYFTSNIELQRVFDALLFNTVLHQAVAEDHKSSVFYYALRAGFSLNNHGAQAMLSLHSNTSTYALRAARQDSKFNYGRTVSSHNFVKYLTFLIQKQKRILSFITSVGSADMIAKNAIKSTKNLNYHGYGLWNENSNYGFSKAWGSARKYKNKLCATRTTFSGQAKMVQNQASKKLKNILIAKLTHRFCKKQNKKLLNLGTSSKEKYARSAVKHFEVSSIMDLVINKNIKSLLVVRLLYMYKKSITLIKTILWRDAHNSYIEWFQTMRYAQFGPKSVRTPVNRTPKNNISAAGIDKSGAEHNQESFQSISFEIKATLTKKSEQFLFKKAHMAVGHMTWFVCVAEDLGLLPGYKQDILDLNQRCWDASSKWLKPSSLISRKAFFLNRLILFVKKVAILKTNCAFLEKTPLNNQVFATSDLFASLQLEKDMPFFNTKIAHSYRRLNLLDSMSRNTNVLAKSTAQRPTALKAFLREQSPQPQVVFTVGANEKKQRAYVFNCFNGYEFVGIGHKSKDGVLIRKINKKSNIILHLLMATFAINRQNKLLTGFGLEPFNNFKTPIQSLVDQINLIMRVARTNLNSIGSCFYMAVGPYGQKHSYLIKGSDHNLNYLFKNRKTIFSFVPTVSEDSKKLHTNVAMVSNKWKQYCNTKPHKPGVVGTHALRVYKKPVLTNSQRSFEPVEAPLVRNNIYCFSHRELWDQEKDWQFFALYYFGTPNIDSVADVVIPVYIHRIYDFSLLNTFFTKEVSDYSSRVATPSISGTSNTRVAAELTLSAQKFTTATRATPKYSKASKAVFNQSSHLNMLKDKQDLNVSFSGAGIIKSLLAEFDYFEMKKIDKQNRILLYDLNKFIRKLKKSLWSVSTSAMGSTTLLQLPAGFSQNVVNQLELASLSSTGKPLKTNNSKHRRCLLIQKLLRETCKQRDALIRRTKFIRKLLKNSNSKNLLADNYNINMSKTAASGDATVAIERQPTNHLTSMVLTLLPVLPPDLRPIVKMGNQIAASDLNRLYQRVIYRNDRLKHFLKDPTTNGSYEMKYAQRLLQEAVDNLIQNGKSGVVPEKDARGRALKSLSDLLKGKQGRFRQYLLGKRVDYSGRSVIVVGPRLQLHECGIPKEMALELYLPFLIKRILNENFARTVVGAKALIQKNKPLAWSLLREIMKTCPVLLNRAPTLHRLGFQAFKPKLVDGRAILLHPLVCPAFNADFDGDQMAVHIPISAEARAEAWKLMLSRNNLLSPATGEPLVLPSQDMVLGCYYLTTNSNLRTQKYEKGYGQYFDSLNDVLRAYNLGLITVHTVVWVKWNGHLENSNDLEQPLELRLNRYGYSHVIYSKSQAIFNPKTILMNKIIKTTPGKILFNVLIMESNSP
jgi:DNA-directed RNA polymerase beta' subunit